MIRLLKFLCIPLSALLIMSILSACAVPTEPTPQPNPHNIGNTVTSSNETPTEEATTPEPLEPVTNFPVLTKVEKIRQRNRRLINKESPVRAWDLAGTTEECPYTTMEIVEQIALGDEILGVYERIGLPYYRDTTARPPLTRPMDIYLMIYAAKDGGMVNISVDLAGCCEEDYQYVITKIYYYEDENDPVTHITMDFDTKVRLQVIPLFMAVEQVGVDYLLEKEIITPYEATLYAEEEAVYQASLAESETESTP